jgi:hypothetical protein
MSRLENEHQDTLTNELNESRKLKYDNPFVFSRLSKQKYNSSCIQLDIYGQEKYKMTRREIKTGFWTPEKKGDSLKGKIMEILSGNFGKQYLIKTSDGSLLTTPSHAVLQAKMITMKQDNIVEIIFTGEIPATKKGNNPTKDYSVFVDE